MKIQLNLYYTQNDRFIFKGNTPQVLATLVPIPVLSIKVISASPVLC